MNRHITPLIFVLSIFAAAESPQYLTIYNNGNAVSYHISNIRKITLNSERLNFLDVCKTDSTIDSYSSFDKGIFEFEPSNLEEVFRDSNDFTIAFDQEKQLISVSCQQKIIAISVCYYNGITIDCVTPMSCNASISTTDYSPGLYVISALSSSMTKTLKIYKQ